jgi:hypothetical protein
MKKRNLIALGVASAVFGVVPAVQAADVIFSGQANRAIMYADDGADSDTFFVDSEIAPTLFNITGEHALNDDVTMGMQIEATHSSNNSHAVTIGQKSSVGTNSFQERKLEVFFRSDKMGTLWLGQGEMASENTSEVDLNEASLAGIYSYTGDFGGNLAFRDSNGAALAIDTLIGDVANNFDGLGRDDRVRYDTPRLHGFMLSVAAGTAKQWDASLNYAASFGELQLAAALGYANPGDVYDWEHQYNGSLSVAHSGFSLTLAAGGQEYEDVSRGLGDIFDDIDLKDPLRSLFGENNPVSYYAKLGYAGNLVPMGKTSFGLDYKYTEHQVMVDDEYASYGVGVVQAIDAASTELYLGLRNHELERKGVSNIEDIFVVTAGARVKF